MLSRRLTRALVGACLLALMPMSSALAHAELVCAEPGPEAQVSVVPSELIATFDHDLHADRTSIELRDAAGQTMASGGKDPDSARTQRMPLPPLEPGEYEVRWVSFSADDDELARGMYRFTVAADEMAADPSPLLPDLPPASPGPADPCAFPLESPPPSAATSAPPSIEPSAEPSLAP